MRYTTLLVTEAGVVLFARHCRRLAPEGAAALAAFQGFAEAAVPGVYTVRAEGALLEVKRRDGSSLHDSMATRARVSPLAHLRGPLAKVPSPCAYDAVREPGVATFLTTEDGGEILEACLAAVVGWGGNRFVLPPSDRPRVASLSEQAIRERLPFVEAPRPVSSESPLALVNAVKGLCLVTPPCREAFPEAAAAELRGLFADETRRP